MQFPLNWAALSLLGALAAVAGCSRATSGPSMPEFDPAEAAAAALEAHDKDRDGQLSQGELAAAPGLRSAAEGIDQNNDQLLSKDELAARLQSYQDVNLALFPWSCQVELNGRPLSGATVTLAPEPFLGPSFQTAKGTTDARGHAAPVVHPQSLPGVQCGLYRVEISTAGSGGPTIPPRYNQQTTLGQELASGVRSAEHGAVFRLTSP